MKKIMIVWLVACVLLPFSGCAAQQEQSEQTAKVNEKIENPLNNLETCEKYDIIREGGNLCPALSLRFPVSHSVKTFREIVYKKEMRVNPQKVVEQTILCIIRYCKLIK